MKEQVKVPVIVLAVVVVAGLLYFFGSKAMGVGNLDQGTVKYTPGVPPWQDNKNGAQAPAVDNTGRMPAGMTQPAIGGNEPK